MYPSAFMQQGATEQWPSNPSTSNQPALASLQSYGSDSISTMNVRVLDEYKLQPPITVPTSLMPAAPGASQSTPPLDTTLERQLVESAGKSHVELFLRAAAPGSLDEPRVKKYMDMGYSRAEASLGVAYAQQKDSEDVVDFIKNFRELSSMGYGPALAAGALVRNKNCLQPATEEVLNAP